MYSKKMHYIFNRLKAFLTRLKKYNGGLNLILFITGQNLYPYQSTVLPSLPDHYTYTFKYFFIWYSVGYNLSIKKILKLFQELL